MADIEKVINNLHEIGTFITDHFGIERAKKYARYLDDAAELLKEQKPVEAELEGGGTNWWYVCGDCHGAIDNRDSYCRHCGRKIKND